MQSIVTWNQIKVMMVATAGLITCYFKMMIVLSRELVLALA